MSGFTRVDPPLPISRVPANYQFRKLHVLLTNRCNFTCGMCSIIHEARGALTEQQLRGLIESADQLGFDEIEISGGEPYYLPYFRKVLEDYAGNTEVKLKVCTNAFHLDEALVRTLAGRPRLHFQVSFDGTREVHNAIRVQNRYDAFPRSDRNLRLLADAKIMTSLNTVIQRHNVGNLLDTYRYFRDVPYLFHGFGIVEADTWDFANNDFLPEQLAPLADELEQLQAEAKRDGKNVGLGQEMIAHIRNRGRDDSQRPAAPAFPLHPGYGCSVPWSIVVVDQHGHVFPCLHTDWSDASRFTIKDSSLPDVLFSREYIARSRRRVAIHGCEGCTTACYFHDPVFRRKCLNPTASDIALREAQRRYLRRVYRGVPWRAIRRLRREISRFVNG
jgi:MoaA/NifB/PqqE/SkfB family radical SAM enzyme